MTCADADIDLAGYEKEQLKGALKAKRAYNNIPTGKNIRGTSVDNIRGYVTDSKYDVEMKLHIQSQPLKKFMADIEHDVVGVPRIKN